MISKDMKIGFLVGLAVAGGVPESVIETYFEDLTARWGIEVEEITHPELRTELEQSIGLPYRQ